jgi:CheY-like chemotaxis protein
METKNLNILISAENKLFCEMLKQTMEVNLGKNVLIDTVYSKSGCVNEIEKRSVKPDIAVLDYQQTKMIEDIDCLQATKRIKQISPDTFLIVLSSENEMNEAAKLLAYGADDFVLKDKFAFSHVTNAVKGCLHPSQS